MKESDPIAQSTRPNELTARDAIVVSAVGGGTLGLISNQFWGREIGTEIGVGTGGLTLGILTGLHSHDRAQELIKQGKKYQALFKRVQAFLEISAGYGIAGSSLGFALGREDGAALGIFIGAIWGAITDIIAIGPSQAYVNRPQASQQ